MIDSSNSTAFYINPQAQGGRAAFMRKNLERLPLFQDALRGSFVLAQAMTDAAQRSDSVKDWLRQAITAGVRQFVAVGGDGTIHFLLNALLQTIEEERLNPQEFAFGSIALGSSNDFHKDERGNRPHRLDFSQAKAMSLGLATFGNKKQYFAVNASIGLTAAVNDYFNKRPQWLKMLAYLNINLAIAVAALTKLLVYRAFNGSLLQGQDGNLKTSPVRVTNIGFSRQMFFGGNFSYGRLPKGEALGCFISDNLSRFEVLKNMVNLGKGRFIESKKNHYCEDQSFSFVADQSYPLELDGEIYQIHNQPLRLTTWKGLRICP